MVFATHAQVDNLPMLLVMDVLLHNWLDVPVTKSELVKEFAIHAQQAQW